MQIYLLTHYNKKFGIVSINLKLKTYDISNICNKVIFNNSPNNLHESKKYRET